MSPDVAASVRGRLLNQAKESGEEFERTLVRFAAERLCPDDGLRFDLSGLVVSPMRDQDGELGRRARFCAYLGTARIAVQLDCGAGDLLAVEPDEIVYPTMLDTLPAPRLRAYPRELTVAEKFEAMIKLSTRNSRMKDFHDVWALAGAFAFDGPRLQQAVAACFDGRGTALKDDPCEALTASFYSTPETETRWTRYLAAGSVAEPPPAEFAVVGDRIRQFLGPVRESIAASKLLDAR